MKKVWNLTVNVSFDFLSTSQVECCLLRGGRESWSRHPTLIDLYRVRGGTLNFALNIWNPSSTCIAVYSTFSGGLRATREHHRNEALYYKQSIFVRIPKSSYICWALLYHLSRSLRRCAVRAKESSFKWILHFFATFVMYGCQSDSGIVAFNVFVL